MSTVGNISSSIPLQRTLSNEVSNSAESQSSDSESFKALMIEQLQQVNSMQTDADTAVKQLMTGGDVNPAEVLTSLQKADLSFRMVMQIRNKLMQAYQEIKDVRI